MSNLLVINGSYRENGAIDQALAVAIEAAQKAGANVEVVYLREEPIEFCLNCRACTQEKGEAPGACVLHDEMAAIIARIEAADSYILASPTNFFSATALFKRFMERLLPYAYWPWGTMAPAMRRKARSKKALLIASSAAPGLMARLVFGTLKQLKMTASTIGARPIGTVFIGRMSEQEHPKLGDAAKRRIEALVARLL